MVTKELIESDKRKVEIVRDTFPQWQQTFIKDEKLIEEQTAIIIRSIKQHLNYLHGDWGGIKYGVLPDNYCKWLKQQNISL